jgi:hypothetical protein
MKKVVFFFTVFLLMIFSLAAAGEQKVSVEILYLNHGPLQSTLKDIDKICAQYKDKITVSRYDFESPEGERVKSKKGITQHVPLMIWIDGKNNVLVKGKETMFSGFPTGTGPVFFQGKWTMDDLRNALNEATQEK